LGVAVKIIRSINELRAMKKEWNTFVERNSNNPFLLFELMSKFVESGPAESWQPLFFVGYDGKEIVGIAPLMIRKMFGTRFATVYLRPYYSPDFVVNERFEKEFIKRIIDLLLRAIGCRAIDLVFPSESRNLSALIDHCRNERIHFWIEPCLGHRILKVESDERLLEQSLSRNSRKSFRRAERTLREMGACEILCAERDELESGGFRKIMEIDKQSWKQDWRAQRGQEIDHDLVDIWNGSRQAARNVSDFKCKAWILELNKSPIAFTFILQYKKTAYFTKSSYVAQACYAHCTPGLIVRHAALRALFDSKSVNRIDFLTDFPYMKRWTALCQSRTRILLVKGRAEQLAMSLYMNAILRRILNSARVMSSKTAASKKLIL